MKTMTFFSEKGGTGKTTLTALFSSWLAYGRKEKVYVFDFDFPGYQMMNMRNADLEVLARGESQLSLLAEGNSFYPIGPVKGNYRGFSEDALAKMASKIRSLRETAEGYAVLDFPGRFLQSDPAYYLMREGLLDLVVFPINTDRQTISSALNITSMLRNPKIFPRGGSQRLMYLWNQETANERTGRRDWFATYDRLFAAMGIPVASVRMRNIEILRRDPPVFGFIRNTVCWPERNVRMRCPYVDDLFGEVKAAVDGR